MFSKDTIIIIVDEMLKWIEKRSRKTCLPIRHADLKIKLNQAVDAGVDLSPVIQQFWLWLLADPVVGSITQVQTAEHLQNVQKIIEMLSQSCTDTDEWAMAGNAVDYIRSEGESLKCASESEIDALEVACGIAFAIYCSAEYEIQPSPYADRRLRRQVADVIRRALPDAERQCEKLLELGGEN